MNIVIDTNIFRSDLLFRSNEYMALFDYLNKTKSQVILPQVALQEIEEVYKRELESRLNTLRNGIRNINLALVVEEERIKIPALDIKQETEKYLALVRSFLKITDSQIIPIDNYNLPEVVGRSTKNVKPFSGKDKGFRDTLIWLAVKDFAKKTTERQVIFITNNINDFCDTKNPTQLAPELLKECESEKIKIHIYPSIKDFIKHQSSKLSFINETWLYDRIRNLNLISIAEEYFNSKSTKPSFLKAFELNSNGWRETQGDFEIINTGDINIDNFWVYEMANGGLVINIDLTLVIEVVFSYAEYYQDGDGSIGGGLDLQRDAITHRGTFSLKIDGQREIEKMEFVELAYFD